MKKLKLNKKTIVALDNETMSEVKGGFTYSLSMGQTCKFSKSYGSKNASECGADSARHLSRFEGPELKATEQKDLEVVEDGRLLLE